MKFRRTVFVYRPFSFRCIENHLILRIKWFSKHLESNRRWLRAIRLNFVTTIFYAISFQKCPLFVFNFTFYNKRIYYSLIGLIECYGSRPNGKAFWTGMIATEKSYYIVRLARVFIPMYTFWQLTSTATYIGINTMRCRCTSCVFTNVCNNLHKIKVRL